MSFYTLKDFVHEQGLNMGEFKRLDMKTQQKWRQIHQRKLKEKLIERDKAYDEYLFDSFLRSKYVNPDTFDDLAEWKKEEWHRQFEEWKKEQARIEAQARKSKEQIEYETAMQFLYECGVPFDIDGPLGI